MLRLPRINLMIDLAINNCLEKISDADPDFRILMRISILKYKFKKNLLKLIADIFLMRANFNDLSSDLKIKSIFDLDIKEME